MFMVSVFFLSSGAMLAICDVNEYRKCVKDFNNPFVSQLFDTLHALCNLLLVVPDNLKQVCTGEQLVSIICFSKYYSVHTSVYLEHKTLFLMH